MPDSHTRRRAGLRFVRVICFMAAAALVVPLVEPSAALGREENPSQRGSGAVSDALLVRMRSGVADAETATILSRAGATELGRIDDPSGRMNDPLGRTDDPSGRMNDPLGLMNESLGAIHVVSVAAAQRDFARRVLQADPRVVSVEDDATASAAVTPSDPHWEKQWNARRVRAGGAWDVTRGDKGVIIAIVDTGVDSSHPDLRGRMVRGWDFHNNDPNPYDDDGHGTAVATTAAAAGNDGVGIAGMCWQCRIMPVKVLNGKGHGSHSNIAAGVIWAADHGADVINMSIAGLSATTLLGNAVAYAQRKGSIVVAAAGNFGTSRRTFPAAYPGVISVAATNDLDRLYRWSNRGNWVTMAAPGCAFSGRPHARWAWLCGTSLAAPIVSGTLGLMESVVPRLSRTRLTAMLTNSTANVRTSTRSGRLDATRAVRAVLSVAPNPQPDPTPTPTPGPTATPTPPARGDYTWRGSLDSDDHWDREQFYLRGHVHVTVDWSGTDELALSVANSSGDVVASQQGASLYLEFDVRAEQYTFTLEQQQDDPVTYEVSIEYGIVE